MTVPSTTASTPIRDVIPALGLGTWPLTGSSATDAVLSGIGAGYRLIDTAAIYDNEDAVGRALTQCALPRDELFVTTKLRGTDHLSGDIRGAIERSTSRLGLDYLDLFLIHWPLPKHDKYIDAFSAMLDCRDAGLVRYVGVSNFTELHLRRTAAQTGEAPAVNQIQMNPTLARHSIRRVDDELGVLTQSWSPLGRGDVLASGVVTAIATRLGCAPAQVALAWHLHSGVVPIVRSANPARQAENLAASEIHLTDDDIAALASLDRGDCAARDPEQEEHY